MALNLATEKYFEEDFSKSELNEDIWKANAKKLRYVDVPVSKKEEGFQQDIDFPDPPDFDPINIEESTFRLISKILLFTIIILVLAFIIFRVVTGNFAIRNKKLIREEDTYTLEHIEKNLHKADLDHFIKKALASENYRLAVRLYFLAIIKALSLKEWIDWQREKTNGAYLMEMRGKAMSSDFKKITLIFEYVWYSDAVFRKKDFEEVQIEFKKLLQMVKAA